MHEGQRGGYDENVFDSSDLGLKKLGMQLHEGRGSPFQSMSKKESGTKFR